jgi:DMSO reductase anchor subunit
MRRILTTLMILLAVVVAGLTALVLLVNPNDFRAYMVHKVADVAVISSNSMARCAGTSGRSSAFSPAHDADRAGGC